MTLKKIPVVYDQLVEKNAEGVEQVPGYGGEKEKQLSFIPDV